MYRQFVSLYSTQKIYFLLFFSFLFIPLFNINIFAANIAVSTQVFEVSLPTNPPHPIGGNIDVIFQISNQNASAGITNIESQVSFIGYTFVSQDPTSTCGTYNQTTKKIFVPTLTAANGSSQEICNVKLKFAINASSPHYLKNQILPHGSDVNTASNQVQEITTNVPSISFNQLDHAFTSDGTTTNVFLKPRYTPQSTTYAAYNVVYTFNLPSGFSFDSMYDESNSSLNTNYNYNTTTNELTVLYHQNYFSNQPYRPVVKLTSTLTGTHTFSTTMNKIDSVVVTPQTQTQQLTIVPSTDVSVSAVVSGSQIEGQNQTVVYTVTNNSSLPVTNFVADLNIYNQDLNGFNFVTSIGSLATVSQSKKSWSIANLPGNSSHILTISGTNPQVEDSSIYLDTSLGIISIDQLDSNTSNNYYSESLEVYPTPKYTMEIENDGDGYLETEEVDFEFYNPGPNDATNVQILINYNDSDFEPIEFDPYMGTFDSTTKIWTIPSVPDSSTTRLVIEGKLLKLGTVNMSMELLTATQPYEMTNNTQEFSFETVDNTADIEVGASVLPKCYQVGDQITYDLTIRNRSLLNKIYGTTKLELDPKLTFLSESNNGRNGEFSFDTINNVYEFDFLNQEELVTSQVKAEITALGDIESILEVDYQDRLDSDSTPNNQDLQEDDMKKVVFRVYPGCGTISGKVYFDKNNNGTQETEEPGISGLKLLITSPDDSVIPFDTAPVATQDTTLLEVTTDANGNYSYSNGYGDYNVNLDISSLPAQYTNYTITTLDNGGVPNQDLTMNTNLVRANNIGIYAPIADFETPNQEPTSPAKVKNLIRTGGN